MDDDDFVGVHALEMDFKWSIKHAKRPAIARPREHEGFRQQAGKLCNQSRQT
jgi:hypothetical protein